ncbi:MAG TPA: GNAT family N-acetyltransferase [Rubrivivax sp.]|nr:GNAT family N-acetyltransferase [Rubrivivax sp.]
MTADPALVRPVGRGDFAGWLPLWNGYNAFYGRHGDTALPEAVTMTTWGRFFDPEEPVFALVAMAGDRVVGLVHYLYHRSTTRIEPVCYLQDLFTLESERGRGIGRALIHGVYAAAQGTGIQRVYWHTNHNNTAGRLLYDKVGRHAGFILYSHEG